MTSIHRILLATGCVAGILVLYRNHFLEAPQTGLSTTRPEASLATGINSVPSTNGAAEYRASLAIAFSKIDEQNPLRAYQPTSGIRGRIALEDLYARGIPATPKSATLALGLLHSGKLSDDEKIALTAILYGLHNRENTSGANQDIALELKKMAYDANKQIAHDAAVYYAALEYMPGTEYVLKDALRNDALDTDSYFRAMAHLIPSAPPEKRKEFMTEIRASKNSLASSILANALNSGQDFNAASFLKSSDDMAKLLRDTEPPFDEAVGKFGGVDALRYVDWLRASATIESTKTGRSVNDIIVSQLSAPGTDARKVLAYLSSPEATPLLEQSAPDSQVQKLAAIARLHSNQNPGNIDMALLADLMEARMTNPPPAGPKPVFGPPTGPVMPPTPTPQAPQTMPGR